MAGHWPSRRINRIPLQSALIKQEEERQPPPSQKQLKVGLVWVDSHCRSSNTPGKAAGGTLLAAAAAAAVAAAETIGSLGGGVPPWVVLKCGLFNLDE